MKKLLFVCMGNTCRSPMAAAYCNLKYKNVYADSAGISTDGSGMNEMAKRALATFGFDISEFSSHVSKPVSTKLIDGADLIVCVNNSICAFLKSRFPQAKDKITHFSPSIPDPYGGDEALYVRCLELMADQIDKALEKL